MNKKALCIITTIVMVMCMVMNLNMLTVKAVDEDDPRISFDANGGSGSMETVYMNGNYILPECGFTPPEGYQFKHWLVNNEVRYPGDSVYVSHEVAIAIWEPIPAKVIYDNGGGTGAMEDVEIYGDYTLPSCGFTAPDGQQFKSWQLDGQEKQPGDSIYVDCIVTATALWEDIPAEVPTDVPISTSDNNDENQNITEQITEPNISNVNTGSDITLVITIAVIAVLICLVCVVSGVLVVLLIVKKKK